MSVKNKFFFPNHAVTLIYVYIVAECDCVSRWTNTGHFLFSLSVDRKILKKRRKHRVKFANINESLPFHHPLPANHRVAIFYF